MTEQQLWWVKFEPRLNGAFHIRHTHSTQWFCIFFLLFNVLWILNVFTTQREWTTERFAWINIVWMFLDGQWMSTFYFNQNTSRLKQLFSIWFLKKTYFEDICGDESTFSMKIFEAKQKKNYFHKFSFLNQRKWSMKNTNYQIKIHTKKSLEMLKVFFQLLRTAWTFAWELILWRTFSREVTSHHIFRVCAVSGQTSVVLQK